MSPSLATVLCLCGIVVLVVQEVRDIRGVSRAIWVPLIWMCITGSRFLSQWLNLGVPVSPEVYLEGSPIDRAFFLATNILGALILARRRIDWNRWLRRNAWVWLFFALGLLSIVWSQFPYITLKRWLKAVGTLIMALIILTEERPVFALGVLLRILAYLLLPLSVLFIKYYPDIGREYHLGHAMFTGVTTQKNQLGQLTLILTIYYLWYLLFTPPRHGPARRVAVPVTLAVVGMAGWLMYMSQSATSLVCLVLASGLLLFARLPAMALVPRRLLAFGLAAGLVFGVLQISTNLAGQIITALGRDSTLTTRVPMWIALLGMVTNPIVGAGFESFWLGDRLASIWEVFGRLNQAHNGYLETYLNLGLGGLAILVVGILAGVRTVRAQLSLDYPFAILRLVFIATIVVYNWTEATYYGVNLMWMLLFVSILDVPRKDLVVRAVPGAMLDLAPAAG
jgi:O-antigen ligase